MKNKNSSSAEAISHSKIMAELTNKISTKNKLEKQEDDCLTATPSNELSLNEEQKTLDKSVLDKKKTRKNSIKQFLFGTNTKPAKLDEIAIKDFCKQLTEVLDSQILYETENMVKRDIIPKINESILYRRKHMALKNFHVSILKEDMDFQAIDKLNEKLLNKDLTPVTNRQILQIIIQLAKINTSIEKEKSELKNFDQKYLYKSGLEQMLEESAGIMDSVILTWISKDYKQLKHDLKSELDSVKPTLGNNGKTILKQFIALAKDIFSEQTLETLKQNSECVIADIQNIEEENDSAINNSAIKNDRRAMVINYK